MYKESLNRRQKFDSSLQEQAKGLKKDNVPNDSVDNLLSFTNDLLLYLNGEQELVLNTAYKYRKEAKAIKSIYNQALSKVNATTKNLLLLNYHKDKLNKFTYYDQKNDYYN